VFYTKYFAKELAAIYRKLFFHNKVYKYFLQKNIPKQNWQEIWIFLVVNVFTYKEVSLVLSIHHKLFWHVLLL